MRELRGCQPAPQKEEKKPTEAPKADAPDLEAMKGWKVVQLRSFVRKLTDFPMSANDIRYANKATLLAALTEYYKK